MLYSYLVVKRCIYGKPVATLPVRKQDRGQEKVKCLLLLSERMEPVLLVFIWIVSERAVREEVKVIK